MLDLPQFKTFAQKRTALKKNVTTENDSDIFMFTEFRKIGHNSGKIGASCVNNG
jgi:hypothetical protein